jgi:subtilisin family serine protease
LAAPAAAAPTAGEPREAAATASVSASESHGEAIGANQVSRSPIRVGLVDGGVDPAHPVFAGVTIHQHGCEGAAVPSAHGTAVASLIAGHAGKFRGAAPGAELYAADIYCGRQAGGAMDDIAEAIAWIVEQRVAVINVSLVGPKNLLLENVVRAASAKGHLIVAAVGNDGPAARPLYPAAYPDVVGVTAVDSRKRVLLEACRGSHVDFAAPGADMSAAVTSLAYSPVRGTSFAAPLVASLLAARLREPDREAAQAAFATLTTIATDLGDKGVDEVYGNGLVGDALRTDPALARAR